MMSQRDNEYLQEMGISVWEVTHPERLEGYHAESIILPDECKLLFVSPVKPKGELAVMFERVLASMNLTLVESLHLYPTQMPYLGQHSIEWAWFSGCDKTEIGSIKILHSPLLTDIQGNNQQRRALWQQIRGYDTSN